MGRPGRPPGRVRPTHPVSVRLEREMVHRLDRLRRRVGATRSGLIARALEEWMEVQEPRMEEATKALAELERRDDPLEHLREGKAR